MRMPGLKIALDRRRILAALVLAPLALSPVIHGAAKAEPAAFQPFSEAAFDAAQKAGRPILIDTYATWCQICARQAPILEKLVGEPQYKNLLVFRVNFDTQKDVMRRFKATVQSTLIAFKGDKEVGRSVGETQPEWIDDLVSKTLAGHES